MIKDAEIIRQFGDALLIDMKKAIPSATGKTAESMEIVYDKNGLGFKIIGGQQIGAIIDGRGPTKPGAKAGPVTVQEQILEWIKAKNIQPKESITSQLSLSWAISTAIHKNGTRGKGNIFDKVITDARINSVSKTLLDSKNTVTGSDVIQKFKFQ